MKLDVALNDIDTALDFLESLETSKRIDKFNHKDHEVAMNRLKALRDDLCIEFDK